MIWLMPRSHLGALTGYLRPNTCGVSTRAGRLPHGPWPRLLMLWMYAELRRSPCGSLDLVHALSDFLRALGAAQYCPFALDVYLWDTCYRDFEIPSPPSEHSRLALCHTLADHPSARPSLDEVQAFERDLAAAREKLQRLKAQADPPREGDPFRWIHRVACHSLASGRAPTACQGAHSNSEGLDPRNRSRMRDSAHQSPPEAATETALSGKTRVFT